MLRRARRQGWISRQRPLWVNAPATASRDLLLAGVLAAVCLSAITIPLSGYISDRIGRKNMYVIGCATMGVFAMEAMWIGGVTFFGLGALIFEDQ